MHAPGLKKKLAEGATVFAGWIQAEHATNAAALARAGLDAVVLDLQHGALDIAEMRRGATAIITEGCAPIVRTPYSDTGMIGRALDTGAEGIIAPMINSAHDASAFAKAAKFPPDGQRSWGPDAIRRLWGMDNETVLQTANDWVVTWAMIETQTAMDHMRAIVTTDGIDGIFVGPNDLSIALSGGKSVNPGDHVTLQACETIARRAAAHNVYAGIFANTPELASTYRGMGFQFIALSTENALLSAGVRAVLEQVRGEPR